MPVTRREFVASSAALAAALARLDAPQGPATDAEALFRRSVIIDGLSADEDWNDPEPIFAGCKTANLSAIHTSPANLTIALRNLAARRARFARWPDRLMKIDRGICRSCCGNGALGPPVTCWIA